MAACMDCGGSECICSFKARLRAEKTRVDDWQARALAAEADVARFRVEVMRGAEHVERLAQAFGVHDEAASLWAASQPAWPAPTSPAAVAALVRAARLVCDHYRDDHDLDVDPIGTDRIDNLRALLDAPPWRDLR